MKDIGRICKEILFIRFTRVFTSIINQNGANYNWVFVRVKSILITSESFKFFVVQLSVGIQFVKKE